MTPGHGEFVRVRLELRTEPDSTFFGRVIEAETGAPIARASVTELLGELEPVETDVDGVFHFPVRSWIPPSLSIKHPGRALVFLDASAGHETQVTARQIPLVRAASIRAAVRRDANSGPFPVFPRGPQSDDNRKRHAIGVYLKA